MTSADLTAEPLLDAVIAFAGHRSWHACWSRAQVPTGRSVVVLAVGDADRDLLVPGDLAAPTSWLELDVELDHRVLAQALALALAHLGVTGEIWLPTTWPVAACAPALARRLGCRLATAPSDLGVARAVHLAPAESIIAPLPRAARRLTPASLGLGRELLNSTARTCPPAGPRLRSHAALTAWRAGGGR